MRTGRFDLYFEALVTQQLYARPPMKSPTPATPEHGRRPDDEGMEQHAYLARLPGGAALPLTLLTQQTGATTADAGRIDNTQTSIGLAASLMSRKQLPCWTAKRPIRLERKLLAREATCLPGSGRSGWTIPRCGSG